MMFRKIVALLFLILGISLALLMTLTLLPLPRYRTFTPVVDVQPTLEHISEGKRIALTICIRCHYNYETGALAGRQHGNPKRLGDFSSGNITRDSATGIGAWTTGQLYYFLKTSIKPDGNYVFDMPKYPNLSDEDMQSLIAFLQSDDSLVRKTQNAIPRPRYSLLTKVLIHTVLQPPTYEDKIILQPDTSDPVMFGKYLATAKFSCYECHSLGMVTTNYNQPEKSWGFFRGGNPEVNEQREKIYTPDITGDTLNGIGKWSEEQFVRIVKNGIKPDGTTVRDPMFPFYLLSEKEVKAIYAYLKTLK